MPRQGPSGSGNNCGSATARLSHAATAHGGVGATSAAPCNGTGGAHPVRGVVGAFTNDDGGAQPGGPTGGRRHRRRPCATGHGRVGDSGIACARRGTGVTNGFTVRCRAGVGHGRCLSNPHRELLRNGLISSEADADRLRHAKLPRSSFRELVGTIIGHLVGASHERSVAEDSGANVARSSVRGHPQDICGGARVVKRGEERSPQACVV